VLMVDQVESRRRVVRYRRSVSSTRVQAKRMAIRWKRRRRIGHGALWSYYPGPCLIGPFFDSFNWISADGQSNGEKASPGPVESLLRSSPLVAEALVIGSDQPQLGVLIFARSSTSSSSELLRDLEPLLTEANASSPSFAQVSKDMCLVITDPKRLEVMPKSSKGTIQRGVAYQVYTAEIASLYATNGDASEQTKKRSLEEITQFVKETIVKVVEGKRKVEGLESDTDLFSWGVDSLMATRIRASLQKVSSDDAPTLLALRRRISTLAGRSYRRMWSLRNRRSLGES